MIVTLNSPSFCLFARLESPATIRSCNRVRFLGREESITFLESAPNFLFFETINREIFSRIRTRRPEDSACILFFWKESFSWKQTLLGFGKATGDDSKRKINIDRIEKLTILMKGYDPNKIDVAWIHRGKYASRNFQYRGYSWIDVMKRHFCLSCLQDHCVDPKSNIF